MPLLPSCGRAHSYRHLDIRNCRIAWGALQAHWETPLRMHCILMCLLLHHKSCNKYRLHGWEYRTRELHFQGFHNSNHPEYPSSRKTVAHRCRNPPEFPTLPWWNR